MPEMTNGVVVSDTGHAGIWTARRIELNHTDQRYYRIDAVGSTPRGFGARLESEHERRIQVIRQAGIGVK